MSRLDMSLPIVTPKIRPRLDTASASSGSGTFQAESARMRTSSSGPATRPAVALKNSSGRAAS